MVLELGAHGAYFSNASDEEGHVEAQMVEQVMDPTGAGHVSFTPRCPMITPAYELEDVTANLCASEMHLCSPMQKQHGQWDMRSAVGRAC